MSPFNQNYIVGLGVDSNCTATAISVSKLDRLYNLRRPAAPFMGVYHEITSVELHRQYINLWTGGSIHVLGYLLASTVDLSVEATCNRTKFWLVGSNSCVYGTYITPSILIVSTAKLADKNSSSNFEFCERFACRLLLCLLAYVWFVTCLCTVCRQSFIYRWQRFWISWWLSPAT